MARARAACIVFDDDRVLLMHRSRDGQQYDVVPGGGIEQNETARDACLRELFEETSLRAATARLIMTQQNDSGATTDYFLIDDPVGHPRIGAPEAERESPSNHYELRWVALRDIHTIPLRPETAVEAIATAFSLRSEDTQR